MGESDFAGSGEAFFGHPHALDTILYGGLVARPARRAAPLSNCVYTRSDLLQLEPWPPDADPASGDLGE